MNLPAPIYYLQHAVYICITRFFQKHQMTTKVNYPGPRLTPYDHETEGSFLNQDPS